MRLHRYGVNTHTAPDGKTVLSATLWYENRDDMTGNVMSGSFHASAEEYNAFLTDEITSEDLIKEKIAKLLDLNADADIGIAIHEFKTQITEKDAEIARLNEALMEMVLMISNLTIPDIDIPEPEEPPTEDEPVEEVEEDGEIITDDIDGTIDPIDTNTEEGGEGGE